MSKGFNVSKIIFIKTPPKEVYVAFSGGVDSIVLLHTLLHKDIDVKLLFVHHNTEYSNQELSFVNDVASRYNIDYIVKNIPEYDGSNSLEAFWSRQRFNIFQAMDRPVLTGHHLNDAVEWYVMSSMQGQSKVIDFRSGNIQRPMILIKKENIVRHANENRLEYLTDPSNFDVSFSLRNKVRHELIGNIKNCFPGIETTVRKIIARNHRDSEAVEHVLIKVPE